MSNLHLVTGYAGKEHITSNDQGSFNAAIMGAGEFVLERGKQFEVQVISNNIVRVFDGDLLMQGRHIRLKENTYVDLFFENGTQGYKRTDLIAVRYEKDATTDVESASLVVIKGAPSEDSYVTPEKITGDIINNHALQNDTVLYQVKFDGLRLQEPEKVFSTLSTIEKELEDIKINMIKDIENYIQEKIKIVDEKLKINTWGNAGIVDKAIPPQYNNGDLYSGYPLERGLTWQQVPSNKAQPKWGFDWRFEGNVFFRGSIAKGATGEVVLYKADPLLLFLEIEFINANDIYSKSTRHCKTYSATNIYRDMNYYGNYGKLAGYDPLPVKESPKFVESFSLYKESTSNKIGDFVVIFHFATNEDYDIYVVIDDVKSTVLSEFSKGYLYMVMCGVGTNIFN